MQNHPQLTSEHVMLPEGGAHKHREWQPMPDLRRGREDEGDDDDEVGEDHGGDALEREHVEVHEAAPAREVASRHADDEPGTEAGKFQQGRHAFEW
jgi:hypothetical protein